MHSRAADNVWDARKLMAGDKVIEVGATADNVARHVMSHPREQSHRLLGDASVLGSLKGRLSTSTTHCASRPVFAVSAGT